MNAAFLDKTNFNKSTYVIRKGSEIHFVKGLQCCKQDENLQVNCVQ